MKIIKVVSQIALLYVIYLVGVWLQETLHLFIPGSIVGMFILFILLLTKAIRKEWIEVGSQLLIKHLALLFLPVTVGIVSFIHLFSGKGFFIIIIVLLSTFLVMTCTGLVSQKLAYRKVQKNE